MSHQIKIIIVAVIIAAAISSVVTVFILQWYYPENFTTQTNQDIQTQEDSFTNDSNSDDTENPTLEETSNKANIIEFDKDIVLSWPLVATLNGKKQVIDNFIVPYLVDEGKYVIAASEDFGIITIETEPPSYEQISNNYIYLYNPKTDQLETILEADNEKTINRIIGLDDGKIVVLKDLIDNSPGPCASPWLLTGASRYQVLDLSGNKPKLVDYAISKEKVAEENEKEETCAKELFAE